MSNNSIEGHEVKREHNGDHSTSGRITHYLEFGDNVVGLADVLEWLENSDWLGYNPAGYGATEIVPDPKFPRMEIGAQKESKRWIYKHSACCD